MVVGEMGRAPYRVISAGHMRVEFSRTRSERNNGLPSRRASQPWWSDPLVSPASTMMVASEMSAMVRFRMGKWLGCVLVPGENCESAR